MAKSIEYKVAFLPATLDEDSLTEALNAIVHLDGGGWRVVSSMWGHRMVVFLER